jgi:hypothetical protein
MQIQRKVNFETIQVNITENQNTQKSDSQNNLRDIFDSKIQARMESALFKKAKTEADYYTENVEGSGNSKDEEQIADDQSKNYAEAKELFKRAMQMLLDSERRKAAITERV